MRLLPVWVLLIGVNAWGAGPLFNIRSASAAPTGTGR